MDSRIVTDMLSLAWQKAYDVPILVTSDMDMGPAVESLQTRDFNVINATWKGHGRDLAQRSWASVELDDHISDLIRVEG